MGKVIIFYENHDDEHSSQVILALLKQLQIKKELDNIIFCLEEAKNVTDPVTYYTDLQEQLEAVGKKYNDLISGLEKEIKKSVSGGPFFKDAAQILAIISPQYGFLNSRTGESITLDQYLSMPPVQVHKILKDNSYIYEKERYLQSLAIQAIKLLQGGGGSVFCIDIASHNRAENMDERNTHFVQQIEAIRMLNRNSTIIFLVGRDHCPIACTLMERGHDVCEYYVHDKSTKRPLVPGTRIDETGDVHEIIFDEHKYVMGRELFANTNDVANFIIIQNELLRPTRELGELMQLKEMRRQQEQQQKFKNFAFCTSVLASGVFVAAYYTASVNPFVCIAYVTSIALLAYAHKEEVILSIDCAYNRAMIFVESLSQQLAMENDNAASLTQAQR
jgi:hypothetical protein